MKTISNGSIIIDDYLRYSGKEEAEMPHDDVLVVQIRMPNFPFVLATCGEHASGRSIVGTSDHLANLSCLTAIIFWIHGMP